MRTQVANVKLMLVCIVRSLVACVGSMLVWHVGDTSDSQVKTTKHHVNSLACVVWNEHGMAIEGHEWE